MPSPRAVRISATLAVLTGFALPIVRRAARLGPGAVIAGAAVAPLALCVAVPRSRRRDVGVCALQMWAYLAAYKLPNAEGQSLEHRVRVEYPIAVDRLLGGGELPSVRLQRALAAGPEFRAYDKALIWTHWVWFAVPHTTLSYLLVRHPRRFPRAAVLTYAVFDIGAVCYWLFPTAPPWYAAERGRIDRFPAVDGDGAPVVRRMMVEYGESFWRDGWGPLYSLLGGNPLAAMPSLHFATSVMAATLLAETGPAAGGLGWTYALALGFALVYLGEHYVADLLAGLALTVAVRRAEPLLGAPIAGVGRAVSRFAEWARAG
ncbi:MAG TPA: phosphatase PAP2 family protein [Solirubrobacteraceae bacterium]|nr:phosphatase PAP2 family protein [Solirubrobacteraceae bacterium]